MKGEHEMIMDSKGFSEYVEEYRNSHGGKSPTCWKVEVFRWDKETPAELWRYYFSTGSEAEEMFREERYYRRFEESGIDCKVGLWEFSDGDERNVVNWKIAQCGARIVLPISAKYAHGILAGDKLYEYRRRMPKRPISQIVIYETAPMSRVVGTVDVCGVLEGEPGELYEMTSYGAGISREDYDEYLRGCEKAYAFELGAHVMFDCCPSVERYGLKGAPQSFAYVKGEVK